MNGDTKNKLKGGIWGIVLGVTIAMITFLSLFGKACFGYGELTNRVYMIEGKVPVFDEINRRLAVIETDIKWIKKHK